METKMWVISLVLLCALIGSVAQILFKLASKDVGGDIMSWLLNWKLILAVTMYGMTTVIFVWALKHGNLSILYPVIATSYVFVVILSTVILKEPFPAVKWLGIALILAGVTVIAYK